MLFSVGQKIKIFMLIFSRSAAIIRTDVPDIEIHVLSNPIKGRMSVLFDKPFRQITNIFIVGHSIPSSFIYVEVQKC